MKKIAIALALLIIMPGVLADNPKEKHEFKEKNIYDKEKIQYEKNMIHSCVKLRNRHEHNLLKYQKCFQNNRVRQ